MVKTTLVPLGAFALAPQDSQKIFHTIYFPYMLEYKKGLYADEKSIEIYLKLLELIKPGTKGPRTKG